VSKQRTTEVIRWIRTLDELPDEGVTVLLFGDMEGEPVWLGYLDEVEEFPCDCGKCIEVGRTDIWRTVDGAEIEGVTHWAEMPCGPVMSAEVGK
jgi:hypothetical protein